MRQLTIATVLLFALLNVGVAAQAIYLQRIFRSTAWVKIAGALVFLCMRFFYGVLVPGPSCGPPSTLTAQWGIGVILAILVYLLFASGFHDLRRDLDRIGVRGREFR